MLDKPAAIIKLTETEMISSKKVNQNITLLEANAKRVLTADEKRSVLDSMVDSAIVVQAAKRDKIVITDAQVKQYGIAQVSKNLGKQLSEAEFLQFVEQQMKQSPAIYLEELKKQLMIQKYITETGRSDFQNIPEPSENEIQSAYEKEEMTFVNPEMMRVSHIFFTYVINGTQNPRIMSDDEKDTVREKADSVLRNLKNGTITYEEGVRTYSEDPQSKIKAGDIGFIIKNDNAAVQIFGTDFVNQVYTMQVGNFKLIESKAGLHIVKVTDRIGKKFLKLDDQVNPMEQTTVREYISQRLYAVKQQNMFKVVSERIIKDLREGTEITLYLQNLGW
jgi:parvulin-like peptidyl-prolyl isomerase